MSRPGLQESDSSPLKGRNDDGAAVYTPWLLYLYDFLVLFVTNSFAWKCSTSKVMLPLFQSTLSENHVDIGVGTGYFPAQAIQSGCSCKKMTLIDLNPSALAAAKGRVSAAVAAAVPPKHLQVNTIVADATEPLPIPESQDNFTSMTMFYLIHCIPGPPQNKVRVFDVARRHLAEDGVLAGATVLGRSRPMNWLAWILMNTHNRSGIFHNWDDTAKVFEEGLRSNFDEVETWIVGRSFLFRARKPRQD